jgi:FkbM family methyltransferase
MLRRLLERLSRNLVLRRHLPAEFGRAPLLVTPGSALNLWRFDLGKADPMLFSVVREHVTPGDTVWDVGANVGLFSFAAAARAGGEGRVLALEADSWLVGLLRRSASLPANRALHVEVLPAAAAERVDVARFNIAVRGRAASYLDTAGGSSQAGGVLESQLVPTVSLDWLLDRFPAPSFVKIDVEGGELAVLKGASRLLSEARPAILCEVFGERRSEVDALLRGFGYELFDAVRPAGERVPLDSSVENTLAYPPGYSRETGSTST